MKREDFEHAVRAAGGVLGIDELLVIGSQALHAGVQGEIPEGGGLEAPGFLPCLSAPRCG